MPFSSAHSGRKSVNFRKSRHPRARPASLELLESRQMMAVDLSAAFAVVPSTVVNGTRQAASITVFNDGDTRFRGSIKMDLYVVRAGETPDSSTFVGRVSRSGPIAAGGQKSFTVQTSFSSALASGDYQIVAVIDPQDRIAETDETNNTAVSGTVQVASRNIDLVAGFAPRATTVSRIIAGSAGGGVAFATIRNAGTTVVPGGTSASVQVYARPIAVADGSADFLVNTHTVNAGVGSLLPGQTRTVPVSIQFPRSTPVGNYLLYVVVDANGEVAETNEGNNVALASSVIPVVNFTGGTVLVVPNPTGGNSLTGISIGSFVPAPGTINGVQTNLGSAIIGAQPLNIIGRGAGSSIGRMTLNSIGGLNFSGNFPLGTNVGPTLIGGTPQTVTGLITQPL